MIALNIMEDTQAALEQSATIAENLKVGVQKGVVSGDFFHLTK